MSPAKKERGANLELRSDDGVRLVSLTAGVTLYTDVVLSENPKAVLGLYDLFLSAVPPSVLKFYGTENMRRHKPVTKRVLEMLPTWLEPGAPPREYIYIDLKDGEQYQDAALHKFHVYGLEPTNALFGGGRANLVSMAFPPAWALTEPERLLNFVTEATRLFPYVSGHAGLSLEVCPYETEESQTHAWRKSMRYRGVDVSRPALDAIAAGHDGVKTVNWLTLLGTGLVEKLGGRAKLRRRLSRDIEILETQSGLILKAGSRAELGDSNRSEALPLYKEVYRAVEPLIDVARERAPSFDIEEDYVEKTQRWYRRLEDA